MKGFFYLPKKRILIPAVVIFAIFIGLNIFFYSFGFNKPANKDTISLFFNMFTWIMLVCPVVLIFVVSYLVNCVDKKYKAWGEKSTAVSKVTFLKVGTLFIVLDIILAGIFLLLWYIGPYFALDGRSIEKLLTAFLSSKSISIDVIFALYFRTMASLIAYFGITVVFIVDIVRKLKFNGRQKKILTQRKWYYANLGFDYEQTDFYRQTQMPFRQLKHGNGTYGEFEVYHRLYDLHKDGAQFAFNREIPKEDGLTTEIDVIMIHKNGIFVIENKDYEGTVYGKASDYDWTVLYHGKKKIIYNPIKQNEGHCKALKNYLEKNGLYASEKTPVYSIIVFTDIKSDHADDAISLIETEGTDAKVCTSQNLLNVVKTFLVEEKEVPVKRIYDLLLGLKTREKSL